ncbi:MAG: hypothetical protein ACREXR_00810 [Gammaproteobacteria bacterium]
MIEESILPVAHAEAFMLVEMEEVFNCVAFVSASLINDMIDYFLVSIDTCLATWATLAERPDTDLSSDGRSQYRKVAS